MNTKITTIITVSIFWALVSTAARAEGAANGAGAAPGTGAHSSSPAATGEENPFDKTLGGFIGARLIAEPMILGDRSGMMLDPMIEGGVSFANRFGLVLAFGTVVYGLDEKVRISANPSNGYPEQSIDLDENVGNLMFRFGVRAHLTKPKPKRAFLYGGLNCTWIAPIYRNDSKYNGTKLDSELHARAVKEDIDRLGLGIDLGIEYLVAENFGVGAETGLSMYINKTKDALPYEMAYEQGVDANDVEAEKGRTIHLSVPISLRMTYHF